ncbi:MAG: hypothetical protein GOV02_02945 [Candidatus Aenigmarchaeota archaeon]|nr:hypothetical protein [Candidatus Aenigmarchaeota archaeon]
MIILGALAMILAIVALLKASPFEKDRENRLRKGYGLKDPIVIQLKRLMIRWFCIAVIFFFIGVALMIAVGVSESDAAERHRGKIDISDNVLKCDGKEIKKGDPIDRVKYYCGTPAGTQTTRTQRGLFFGFNTGVGISNNRIVEEVSLIYMRFNDETLTGITVMIVNDDEKVGEIKIHK